MVLSIEFHIQVALYDDGHHKFKPQTKAELFKWLETCCCRKRFWNDNWRERAEIIFNRMIKTGKIYSALRDKKGNLQTLSRRRKGYDG